MKPHLKTMIGHALNLLLIFIGFINVPAQKLLSPDSMLVEVYQHARTASLYRNHVDWSATWDTMQVLGAGAGTVSDLKPAFDHLLKALGDEHGRIFHDQGVLSYYFGPAKPHQTDFDAEVYQKIQYGGFPFMTQLLSDSVGYVRIPGLPVGDNEAMTLDIRNPLCALVDQGARHWIVDLRYNGGGNMFPMVEGLTPILGDGPVGGTTGVTPEESSNWEVRKGNFYYDDYTVGLAPGCQVKMGAKIVVLTSLYTVSSGEALAVIFKADPNTRFLGGPTGGLITATDYYALDDQTAMSISVSYYRDRTGEIYKDYVDVDQEVDFIPGATTADDLAIHEALKWISEP